MPLHWGVAAAIGTVLTAMAALAAPAAAQELPVDLELVLAVDVSGSMDTDERLVQRAGYVAALRHPEVIAAIASGPYGRIAITYVEWAGARSQTVLLPWRAIDGAAAAEALAAQLAVAPSARIRGTSISGALLFAATLFDGNGFEGDRQVIDISGDGPNNTGPPVVPARDAAVARGLVINGLPMTLKVGGFGGFTQPGQLDVYYEDCVIGGPGAFIVSVREPSQIAEAIRRKLVLEIAGPPPGPPPGEMIPAGFEAAAAPRVDCMIGERNRPRWLNDER